jgi:hypothetical protein
MRSQAALAIVSADSNECLLHGYTRVRILRERGKSMLAGFCGTRDLLAQIQASSLFSPCRKIVLWRLATSLLGLKSLFLIHAGIFACLHACYVYVLKHLCRHACLPLRT